MLPFSIVLAAFILYFPLRRIARSLIALVSVFEVTINKLAVRNGQAPITDEESAERLRTRL